MKTVRNKKLWIAVLIFLAVLGLAQLVQPSLPSRAVTQNIDAPPEVQAILQRACYDCHSNETHLKWFDRISPASFLVASHIKKGRAALNFSEWDKLNAAAQKGALFRSFNDIRNEVMPLHDYLLLHGDARISQADAQTLEQYLLTMTATTHYDTAMQHQLNSSATPAGVKPALNGISYISGYTNWKAISTSDRFDNNTIRMIYANGIAVKAIEAHKIDEWPDGTVFAKVAWKKMADGLGNITAGDFVQVEFMIKDSKKYQATKGWGWARWLGADLKPYGKNADFANECISCHSPFKKNDYVFTYPFKLN